MSSHQNHQNIVLVYCLKSVIHLENFTAGILRKFQPIPEFPDSREWKISRKYSIYKRPHLFSVFRFFCISVKKCNSSKFYTVSYKKRMRYVGTSDMFVKREECFWLTSTLHEQFGDYYLLYERVGDFSRTNNEQA